MSKIQKQVQATKSIDKKVKGHKAPALLVVGGKVSIPFTLHHILDQGTVTLDQFEKIVKTLISSDPLLLRSDQYKALMNQNRVVSYTKWNGDKIVIESTTSLETSLSDYFTNESHDVASETDSSSTEQATITFDLAYKTNNKGQGTRSDSKLTLGQPTANVEETNVGTTTPESLPERVSQVLRSRKAEINEMLRKEIHKDEACMWSYMCKKIKHLAGKPSIVVVGFVAMTVLAAFGTLTQSRQHSVRQRGYYFK